MPVIRSALTMATVALLATSVTACGAKKKSKKADPAPAAAPVAETGPAPAEAAVPAYPACETDEHCASKGEVCVDGTCKQCREDAQCTASLGSCGRCVNNACEKAAGCCSRDSDCDAGKRCRAGACS
jgi:hypothetical protein